MIAEKFFFFDIESTGTRFWKNGIHQISGAIRIDNVVKEYFDFKVKPIAGALIEKAALDVGGVTEEQIMAYPDMREVFLKIEKMLGKYVDKFNKKDKFHLAGYNNASFDNQFFRAFFTQNAVTEKEEEYKNYFGSWFWSSPIDIEVLAANKLKSIRHTMENFKLKTVARQLGIVVDDTKLHDAKYDIDLTMQIYDILESGVDVLSIVPIPNPTEETETQKTAAIPSPQPKTDEIQFTQNP